MDFNDTHTTSISIEQKKKGKKHERKIHIQQGKIKRHYQK